MFYVRFYVRFFLCSASLSNANSSKKKLFQFKRWASCGGFYSVTCSNLNGVLVTSETLFYNLKLNFICPFPLLFSLFLFYTIFHKAYGKLYFLQFFCKKKTKKKFHISSPLFKRRINVSTMFLGTHMYAKIEKILNVEVVFYVFVVLYVFTNNKKLSYGPNFMVMFILRRNVTKIYNFFFYYFKQRKIVFPSFLLN